MYTSEDADIYDKEYAVLDPQPGYYGKTPILVLYMVARLTHDSNISKRS